MSDAPNPSASRNGLSLYANLLNPGGTADATISRAPVPFTQDDTQTEASKKQQNLNAAQIAALRFQPTRRPQVANKAKPKSAGFKAIPNQSAAVSVTQVATSISDSRAPAKSTLTDWVALDDEEANGSYQAPKRERGSRKKRKKNNKEEERRPETDWTEIYDPSRPTNYADYIGSEEEVRCEQEWKGRLYAHRRARNAEKDSDSDDDEEYGHLKATRFFAPPTNLSFAPPPMEPSTEGMNDATGDDAYARRLALNVTQGHPPPPPPPPPEVVPPPPAPTPVGVISRAPVRFADLPAASEDIPATEEELSEVLAAEEEDTSLTPAADDDAPRSLRPGQKGFAERLMNKYGWTKGTGLGKDESGIINPLHVQVMKRKKKPDSEGGGFADPKGLGKIVGGQKKKGTETSGSKFGEMSEVVVLRGMVDGMDLDTEVGDGDLMQEIGDECAEKYGRVERVYIDRGDGVQAKVFIKFTSQLSGLRAVNALEGRIFNGNTITALYYDAEKFERGIYE